MAQRRTIGPTAWLLGGAGLLIGAVAAWLISQGNPGNMGLCIACFLRDITGFFAGKVTNQGAVAYIRPEIIGIILGAMGAALFTREFRPRGGSQPLIRFVLGFIFMSSALVFLGCTVRAWLRLGGGDLTAIWGILGIVAGVLIGIVFLKKGFNLGRTKTVAKPLGWILPVFALVLLGFAVMSAAGSAPDWTLLTAAGDGPGALSAPLLISLAAGLLIGIVAQRSRFCSIGGIRDAILVRRYDLLFGVIGLLVGTTVVNLILGQYHLGFINQPVAHNDILGNFAAMTIATFAAMMLGGCPLRQIIMSSEGDADSTTAVAGMLVGAGFTHWAGLASSGKGLSAIAWPGLAVMMVVLLAIAWYGTRKTA
ncbi:MAG: YedE family putative selenium transporter [Coriobacteriia bacterium]|nr:YedE family putative selenium transporter [Coriobacteriia bacterium]